MVEVALLSFRIFISFASCYDFVTNVVHYDISFNGNLHFKLVQLLGALCVIVFFFKYSCWLLFFVSFASIITGTWTFSDASQFIFDFQTSLSECVWCSAGY